MARRRAFTPEFKAKVVLEMLVEGKSLAQASREYGIKDTVLSRWKQQFIERAPQVFESSQAQDGRGDQIAELERLLGRLTLELDAAKKVSKYLD
jgi:transposase-like protein